MEYLDDDVETGFDLFENQGFWDGPDGSSINQCIFRSEVKDLDKMEPPFIWVERSLTTHLPYGHIDHERNNSWKRSGKEYVEAGKEGLIDLKKEYKKGVKKVESYIKSRIKELDERDILDETLVIITSDHGELLGESYLGKKRYTHNFPALRDIAQIPTVFYNYDLDVDCMRLIDVLPTALGIVGKESGFGDGVDIRKNEVKEGINIMKDPKAFLRTKWSFDGENWTCQNKVYRVLKTLLGDFKSFLYNLFNRSFTKNLEKKIEKEIGKDEKEDKLISSDIDF